MKITIKHNSKEAHISGNVADLKQHSMTIKPEEGSEVLEKAIEIVRERFLKKDKVLTICIRPIKKY